MIGGVRAQEIGPFGTWRIDPDKVLEGIGFKMSHDRAKPVGALGVPPGRQMFQAGRMADQSCPHSLSYPQNQTGVSIVILKLVAEFLNPWL